MKDGMVEFDEEAIQKLTELIEDDAETLIDRFKALKDYANEYCAFSGDRSDSDSSVKFIMRTESIGEE